MMQPFCCTLHRLESARIFPPSPGNDDDDDDDYEEGINGVPNHRVRGDVILHGDFWVVT